MSGRGDKVKKVPVTIDRFQDLSLELARCQRALRDELEFSQLLLDASPAFYVAIKTDGTIFKMNRALYDALEYSQEEIEGKDYLTTFVPAEDRENLSRIFRETIEGKKTVNVNRIVSKSGRVYLVEWHGSPVKLESGKPDFFVGVGIDITERRRAEKALCESEERFRALIQNSSDIIQIFDSTGRITYESPSAEWILGYRQDFFIGKDLLDYIHPEDRGQVERELKKVYISTNASAPAEFRIRKANGTYIWVDAIVMNLTGVPGVDGVVVTIRPVEQRKLLETKLVESEERLRLAMEGAEIASFDWNLATNRGFLSNRFYAMLDYAPGEFPPTFEALSALIHPDDRDLVQKELRRQITEKRQLCEIECRFMTKSGFWIWILSRSNVVEYDEKGNATRMTGLIIDITNRKMMEAEIRSLNTVLEQRVKERTDDLLRANEALVVENTQRRLAEVNLRAALDEKVVLLKEIHHRVKNNLQTVTSLLNLQSKTIRDQSTLAAIKESQNRVQAMALVHEKLYLSDDISHISLEDYIRFLGDELFQCYDAVRRGIRFRLEIRDINVNNDVAIPLGLILNELITNSLKYAFPEGRTGEIIISGQRKEHTLTIIFTDNGIGIPADLDWKNAPSLGLQLINSLVDQINGTIDLDRSAGTQFTMVLLVKE